MLLSLTFPKLLTHKMVKYHFHLSRFRVICCSINRKQTWSLHSEQGVESLTESALSCLTLTPTLRHCTTALSALPTRWVSTNHHHYPCPPVPLLARAIAPSVWPMLPGWLTTQGAPQYPHPTHSHVLLNLHATAFSHHSSPSALRVNFRE